MTTEELVGGDGEMAIDAGQLFGPTQRIETTPTALIPADVTPQSTDTQTKLSDDVVGDEVAIDASMLFGT